MRTQTFNLLYKEVRLCLMPLHYVLLLAVSMLLIPNYPRYAAFFYIALGEFWMFNAGALNNDVQYSLALPIRKRDIVKSRCLMAAFYEAAAVLLSVPFAAAAQALLPEANAAGIEANVAFYGFSLVVLTAFHFVFFTQFYKRGEKPGLPFLFGSIAFWASYALCEFPVWLKDSLPAAAFAASGT
ncbi:MAG: ABC-2 transporter permease, partial [Treponemataceae bacterium]|nr:ABC-2 transporter permease [Treponemataceae bacterium]